MQVYVNLLCLFAQPKEGQHQIKKHNNSQNCQKIELYGSLTTRKLKKKHSPRLVGEVEMDSWAGEDSQQGSGWWTMCSSGWQSRQSHIYMRINLEEQLGSKTDHAIQGSSMGK